MKCVVTDCIEDNLDWEAAEMKKAGIGFAAYQLKFKPEAEAVEQREVVIPVSSVRPTLEIVLAMYQSAARRAPVAWPIHDDASIWNVPA